jgi:hypothetical protein
MADPEDETDDEGAAPDAPTERSFGDAVPLRRPSREQIRDAVDATPTLEDRRPDIGVPSYLQKDDSGRLTGAVSKGAPTPVAGQPAPGFTERASDDPTLPDRSLSAPVIEPPGDRPPAAQRSPLVWIAAGLAAVAVALVYLLTR